MMADRKIESIFENPSISLVVVAGLLYPDPSALLDNKWVVPDKNEYEGGRTKGKIKKRKVDSPSGYRLNIDHKSKDLSATLTLLTIKDMRIIEIKSPFNRDANQRFKDIISHASKKSMGSQISFTLACSNKKCHIKSCERYAWYGETEAKVCNYHRKTLTSDYRGFCASHLSIKLFVNGKINISKGIVSIDDDKTLEPKLDPMMYTYVNFLSRYLTRQLKIRVRLTGLDMVMKNYKTMAIKKYSHLKFDLPIIRNVIDNIITNHKKHPDKSNPFINLLNHLDSCDMERSQKALRIRIHLRNEQRSLKKYSGTIRLNCASGLKINYVGKNNVIGIRESHAWIENVVRSHIGTCFKSRCPKYCVYERCIDCNKASLCNVCSFCFTCHKSTESSYLL